MKFGEYLDLRFISFLSSQTRDEAIDSLIHMLDEGGKLTSRDEFRQAIFDREKLVSTGIGMGVAIPHAKLDDITDFFIAVGLQQKKGLDWNALDGGAVRLIFLIGGPRNNQPEYLKILSQLTGAVRDVDVRKALLSMQSRTEVLELLRSLS